jgi:hypothetical protein
MDNANNTLLQLSMKLSPLTAATAANTGGNGGL